MHLQELLGCGVLSLLVEDVHEGKDGLDDEDGDEEVVQGGGVLFDGWKEKVESVYQCQSSRELNGFLPFSNLGSNSLWKLWWIKLKAV